ncbi:helix-turn-helix domain-containing protein [Christiangramia forsetii]|uniref:AraC family transcriptional regulator protein n=2 Tax=Christiangramia forsetii TaxID=411153 RepID=A0M203_CHRFK|nr:helix-turn-helix transcriptional regulator [Christiangramia forsetii]GGG44924.1 hypothetical protein GCM10011532_31090 [Christiangramia forsetii]CAL66648.1 AraC family transcriptional regulator protein [Christiangramia forsetii KT0803]
MKSIQIRSIPVREVIADFANAFDTTYKENCREYWLNIPAHLGEGTIKGFEFSGGISILNYDCKFKEDTEIAFIVDDIHPLKFLYSLEGSMDHRFENEEECHTIEQYQNVIVASSGKKGHVLTFARNSKTCMNSLEINRSKFYAHMECELKDLEDDLAKIFRDIWALESFYYKGYYSLQISELWEMSLLLKHKNFVRKVAMEGIAYQMLAEEILQYQDGLKKDDDGTKGILTRIEVKLINDAATHIKTELGDLGTIEDIARKFGLNVNKLQDGFKRIYKLTVNSYIHKIRLDLAIYLLTNSDHNMSEIVEKIGLNSKSYFSKIFKESYGLSPSQFRRNNHKKNIETEV